MKILIFLAFAHLVGDFFMRNRFLDSYKQKNILILMTHCFVWGCCISIVLEYFGRLDMWKFWFLFAGHFVIDFWKGQLDPHPGWGGEDGSPDISIYKVTDQFLHGLQLLVVWRM